MSSGKDSSKGNAQEEMHQPNALDEVYDYIRNRAILSLVDKGKSDKFIKQFEDVANVPIVEDFIRDPDVNILFVYFKGDNVTCATNFPTNLKKKALYLMKNKHVKDSLTMATLREHVLINEVSESALKNLALIAQEVYYPLLANPNNREGWSGPTSKDIMLTLSGFLANITMAVGQSKGQTLLPAPPPEAFDEDNIPEKERRHLLETSVVLWADRVRGVIDLSPESLHEHDQFPDPLAEVDFWHSKTQDLKLLGSQLASETMQSVLVVLTDMKSPFAAQLQSLSVEVEQAHAVAADNHKYLRALAPHFKRMRNAMDLSSITDHFQPLMHCMLVLWNTSPTYNTNERLITLMHELCNALIVEAEKSLTGELIFRQIEDENVTDAVHMLKTAVNMCTLFKQAFAKFQQRAFKVLPPGSWNVPSETLFHRLDAYIERCNDILDLCKIVQEFSKLEKIYIGGSKGGQLTAMIRQIYADFNTAVKDFQRVEYDILDVTQTAFDDDFYAYRCTVKILDSRLAAVLAAAFDDAATMNAQFKLLDSFEGLIERPIIKDELERKQSHMSQTYLQDLLRVQEHFHSYRNTPFIDANMPPVAGAIGWCRGLRARVTEPMEKLRQYTYNERSEESKEVERAYELTIAQLDAYENKKIEEWTNDIDQTAQEKLRQPLLRRDKDARALHVNFDDALVRLLREVKYLLSFSIRVAPQALTIYEKSKVYRQQISTLNQIVLMYNEIMDTLLPVEQPLVEKDIAHINEILEKGVIELNWKSPAVNDFISEALTSVKQVHTTVMVMKNNYALIKKVISEFAKEPMVERKNKPIAPTDFEENLRRLWESRHKVIQQHQEVFTAKLQETCKALNVNKGSPIWRAYVEFVQESIRDGLAAAIVNSIKFLCEQIDQSAIEKNAPQPMLEIKLGLFANDVMFSAEEPAAPTATGLTSTYGLDGPRKVRRDVWQMINEWVEGLFDIGNKITRMDGSHYVGDLKKNENIVRFINTLKKHADINQRECEQVRQEYTRYDQLYKLDRNIEFNKFLSNAIATAKREAKSDTRRPTTAPNEDAEEGDEEQLDDGNDFVFPLDKFEEKIQYYKQVQADIAEKKPVIEVGFLRINTQPIKTALVEWAGRWIQTYTSYLYTDVTRKLTQLEALMNQVSEGVLLDVRAGDSETLKRVLGYIHQVRSKEKSTMRMFGPLRDSVALLKKYGKNLDEYELKLLNEAPMKWDSVVNTVYKVKEKVNVLQNDEVDKIKEKVRKFNEELKEFRDQFRDEAPFSYEIEVEDAYEDMYIFHRRINQMDVKAAKLTDLEKVFELTISRHGELKKNRLENKFLKQIWDMVSVVRHTFSDWKKTLWNNIDTDVLISESNKLKRQIQLLPPEVRSWNVYEGLVNEVKNLGVVLPMVDLLHSPFMQDRHWDEIKKATGKQFDKDENFCLADLLALELHKHVDEVEYIVELAKKESNIASQLEKIEAKWSTLRLDFGVHPKKSDLQVIHRPDDILATLEEHMSQLQSMQGQGKYVEHFIDRVNLWQQRLNVVETVLNDWLDVQKKWGSLESIFMGSGDIKSQLPEDSNRFDEIDATWRDLMQHAAEMPMVLDACQATGRAEMLATLKVGLEQCEKSLYQYLEMKRKTFPRFYFISNLALLEMLSTGDDPHAVQKHIADCFDNLHHLEFKPVGEEHEEPSLDRSFSSGHKIALRTPGAPPRNPDLPLSNIAIGMHSKEGEEYVPFHEPFACTGAVENWLARLVQRMRDTLKDILARAKFAADHWEIEKPRHKWLFDYPAQIALTASQIIWTEEVNAQFDSFQDGNEQAMKEYSKVLASRLEELINLVLGELTYEDRVKIMTLITVDVHNRDVVAKLIDQKVTESSSFAWQSQMRYTWEDQEVTGELMNKSGDDLKECFIKVADGTWTYSYEYVGNTGRLVITPLTDRCYITLTQALRLIMGGAPAGPAGTGKTETTKDLGRAFGLSVVVWNCSEQMNVQSMSAIFKGLSQTGAWGCFDEFNRIQIEVLSVISTQVATVLNAIRAKREEFDFMGDICRLVPTVGMFITMNPGYAGRTELPENLKALFRSCAMVVPDMDLICENMLMSEGFLQAQRLTKKFVTLYSLCADLLSKQRHYDWGLRAFKAVLRVAGGLKRAEPDVDENRILMRALRDFNLPKLVDADKPIFRQLIDDLFPGLSNTVRKFDKNLEAVIQRVAVQKRNLQPEEKFDRKCVELSELLVIRHSVFIVGPPSSGKSEIWKTLADAYNEMGKETVYDVINPKAVLNKELYGWLSKTDWHDGILSTLIRNMSRNLNGYSDDQFNKWVVLDGDIDPDWIESINSAMDDNKMLTLVSNERIPLTKPMRLVFEISNLDNATPATVSRAGILYINANDIGSKPFLDSWVEKRTNDKEKSSLLALLNRYTTPECLNEIMSTFRRIVPISEINMIRTLCYLLEGLLDGLNEHAKEQRKKGVVVTPTQEKESFEATFVFACIWAFGSAVFSDKSGNTRVEFSDWWKRVFTTVKFPANGTVYDYFVDASGQLVPWTNILESYVPPPDAYLVTQVFVPTIESVRMRYLLDLLVERGRPALLVGGAGTGKTKLMLEYLQGVRSRDERKVFANINVNYYTDAKALQRILESHIDKRAGRIYGPVGNKKLIYLIDDLNMAQVDAYGTQSAMQLIKQQMDYGFWYDTTKLEKKEVRDVQFLACMNPTAGSFVVSDRLQGMFATFAIGMPDNAELRAIYGAVMRAHLEDFTRGTDVQLVELGDAIVKATVDLYDIVATKFLPSTKKFHYQFNLRDLSAVMQGICMMQPKQLYTPKMFVQLWQHECSRVFSDRLVDGKDIQQFDSLLEIKSRDHFKRILQPEGGSLDSAEPVPVFASFVHDPEGGLYLPVEDSALLKQCLSSKLDEYNNNNAVMNLELFTIAMHHICRIVRIIENPQGNALLVGVGGSGKQSLCRLAAHIAGYNVVGLNVSQDYSYHDLRADLQDMYKKAGVKRLPLVFMLTDTQILNDEWLSFINDLLCSGYIPGLFNDDDMDAILSAIRNEAKAKGIPDNRQALIEFFISQVRANLHVVLCFSPVGETFRVRCRKFPGILNACVVDWFHPWPHDALVSVARRFLQDVQLGDAQVVEAIADHMAKVHLSVDEFSQQYRLVHKRFNYTTPKSFLELINFYKMLLGEKRSELNKQVARLQKGIRTLNSTHEDVNKLKENLSEKLVVVAEKKESAEAIISKIAVERKKVNDQRQIAAQEASKAKAVSEICAQISEECRRDLDAAMPIKQKAEEAVKCLSRNSLTVLKNLANPTLDITYVTQAVMILRNFPGKRTWQNAKIMMKDVGRFMDELLTFDATEITDDTLKKLQPILTKDFFTPDGMRQKSEAASNLCSWVVNVVKYNEVWKMIKPKMDAEAKAKTEYEAAALKLKQVEEKVNAMEAKLQAITDQYDQKNAEKTKVEREAMDCQERLALAKRLVEGLADENTRWNKSVTELQEKNRTLIGDVMLAASFVSYLGAFDQEYRLQMWEKTWMPDLIAKQIPLTQNVDPLRVLANDSDFAKWKNEGLAADRTSLENGAIITQCARWPLMIDPQLQGIQWIRGRVKNLITVQQNQPDYINVVIQAISTGQTLLIDNCSEELDATLDPILSRSIIQRGSRKFIKIGTDEVPFHDNFRLFLQTKLANPHYRPEIFAQCTLINFIVTESGLEEQLLAVVVDREQPELEEKRTSLVRAINDYMVSLTDLETEILTRLMDAPPDILSDVALIESLEKTKSASLEIELKVAQSRDQEISINHARNAFRPVAAEASWIYFLLIQLNNIAHMYQFSLNAFISFFRKAMDRTAQAATAEERVRLLRENIRITVFTWVTRGLFEKHKLIFASQLCFKLMMKGALAEPYNAPYYDFLIRAPRKTSNTEKCLDWLPRSAWENILYLSSLEGFEKLSKEMANSPNRFKEWYSKPRPESSPLPLEWRKLDENAPFMKLLVVRALRPDRMISAMENYVRMSLPHGKSFTECDSGKSFLEVLSLSLDDSSPRNPIYFILSPGADPVGSVEILAKKHGMYEHKFHRIALGQGQDIVAMQRLTIGAREGHWVVLENIHLMPVWLKELEKVLDDCDASTTTHPDFRVFVSAEPSPDIPIGILERSLKLTNEPPQGLKQNLQRAFATFDKEHFDYSDSRVKSILFGLCHFHSVIIERTKFGPKGWNRVYPFNTGDLLNSATVIQTYLEAANSNDAVPWKDLRYMVGEILYGGHITDDWDRLLCVTYLKFYLRDELLDEMELYPFCENHPEEHFKSPPVLPYDQYFDYIDTQLVNESPLAFGLHPNEEIAVRTAQATTIFNHILELQPATNDAAAAAGGEGAMSAANRVQIMLESIVERVKGINFHIDDIIQQIVDERGPFQNVFLQECDRMNILVREIMRSLRELNLGLTGELQMSERMELLQNSVFFNRVPPNWEKLAYPSRRPLMSWVENLVERASQLQDWVEEPAQVPTVVFIDKLFNPQSFLTAIMQLTAQKQRLELDKLVIQTDVTRKTVEEIDSRSRDGAYISGLYLEGARMNWAAGVLEECAPREMFFQMPVIACKAIMADKMERNGIYRCPVYKTQQRGQTYVFTANLKTKAPAEKWILAGVSLVMETSD